jgi:hypothetical protein
MKKFFEWLFSLFKKKNKELPAKTPDNNDIIVSEIVGDDVATCVGELEAFLINAASDLRDQEEKAFSSQQLKTYFNNAFKSLQEGMFKTNDYCYLTTSSIGIEPKFIRTFYDIFKKVCASRKITTTLSGDMIRVDTDRVRKIISSMKTNINVEEKVREVMRTGIYR